MQGGMRVPRASIYILARNNAAMGRPLPLSRARNRRLNLYLPGVILIIYKDDLRMMAQNPVAAREGGMKDYEDCIYHLSRLSSI